MERDDPNLGICETFGDDVDFVKGEEVGLSVRDERANGRGQGKSFEFNDEKSKDLFGSIKHDVESIYATACGSASHSMNADVNLDLRLGGGRSISSSKAVPTERDSGDRDTQNKRLKVHSFSLDWGTNFNSGIHYFTNVHEEVGDVEKPDCSIGGDGARNNSDILKMGDLLEVRMEFTDDLLRMVLSFLDHVDLCNAARVCRRWRDASSHEVLWRYLNFENRAISAQQFEGMCQRYPNATAVNVYGTPAIHTLGMEAISSLRNLEVLTLGKGELKETFFGALTDCRMLRSLIVDKATLGGGEISIYHDRLRDLQIVKCRVTRVSIRCPQLETLSLKRSSMRHAVLNCSLLRELDIASCHKLSDAEICSTVTPCSLLESLDVSNCSRVSDQTLQEISQSCGNLRVLDASYCRNIAFDSVRLRMLTVLKLYSCKGIKSASITAIANCSMIEVLELDNCSLLTSVSLDLPRLQNIKLVHCLKFIDLTLRSIGLSSVTISDCPSLQRINIVSNALKKLVLQKQKSLTTLVLQCQFLQEVDLTECESLTNSICEVFHSNGGCPILRSLVLDSCKSLTEVSLCSTSLVSLSLGDCCAVTSLNLSCPSLEHVSLDGCDHLENARFSPVGLGSLNLGIRPKLNVLHIEAPQMVSLELKGCRVLSEAFIGCPLLTSLDASFCSQLKDVLSSVHYLQSLTYLDLSYIFLVNLQPVFDSCLYLKVLKLLACKYLSDASLEPLYKGNALPALTELDLSYGMLGQSAIKELLACRRHLTHVSLNGCNMHDLDWGYPIYEPYDSPSEKVVQYQDQSDRLLQNLNCVGCPNIRKVVIPLTASFHLSSLNLSLSSNLKEVDISCCNLFVLNLSNCYSLEILKLDCPKLTSLFLQSCNINDEAVEGAIIQCHMLETLDVRFCRKMSPSSMVMLRAAFPSLKRIFSSQVPNMISSTS